MDVQDASRKPIEHLRGNESEIAGQANQIPRVFFGEFQDSFGEVGGIRIDHYHREPERPSRGQGRGVTRWCDDSSDHRGNGALGAGFRDGPHIRALRPRADEDGEAGGKLHEPGFYPLRKRVGETSGPDSVVGRPEKLSPFRSASRDQYATRCRSAP